MPTLALVIPAYRRYEVSAIAFPQLAWACRELGSRYGIDAMGIVVADDDNLDIADAAGLDTLKRPNSPLGRKWNDGYEFAAACGYDYLVPCGSDDWLDPDYLARLPAPDEIRASRRFTAVREDGQRLLTMTVRYEGGVGLRIMPAGLFTDARHRPCDDEADRAIDKSVIRGLRARGKAFRWVYSDDPLSIVQFQSRKVQLNTYRVLQRAFGDQESADPWGVLRGRFPLRFVDAAEAHFKGGSP